LEFAALGYRGVTAISTILTNRSELYSIKAKRPTTPDEHADALSRQLAASVNKHISYLDLIVDHRDRLSRRARAELRTRLLHIAVAAQGYVDKLAGD
jgi:hypothetical protein